jgi:hypothetical protein
VPSGTCQSLRACVFGLLWLQDMLRCLEALCMLVGVHACVHAWLRVHAWVCLLDDCSRACRLALASNHAHAFLGCYGFKTC